MYELIVFHILAWNLITEVDSIGPFKSQEECQTAMYIGAKLIERNDPQTRYVFLCRKSQSGQQ